MIDTSEVMTIACTHSMAYWERQAIKGQENIAFEARIAVTYSPDRNREGHEKRVDKLETQAI